MKKWNLILGILIFSIIQPSNSYSEGQTLSYSNQNYVTFGLKVTGHFGKKKWVSFGPELSFGHIFQDPFITSIAFACESINIFEGTITSIRLQGGTYLVGASIGTDWIMYNQKNYLGANFNSWLGLGAYIEGSYLIAGDISGPSVSGKAKLPIYIEKRNKMDD